MTQNQPVLRRLVFQPFIRTLFPVMRIVAVVIGVLWTGVWHSFLARAEPSGVRAESQNTQKSPETVQPADQAKSELNKALEAACQRAQTSLASIKTAHIKYRSSSCSRYKPQLSPEHCAELMLKYDLVKYPEQLRDFFAALNDVDELVPERPWTEVDLYLDGKKARRSWNYRNAEPDVHIVDETVSLDWGAANSQLDITPINKSWHNMPNLADFVRVFRGVNRQYVIKRQQGQLSIAIGEKSAEPESGKDAATQKQPVAERKDNGIRWLVVIDEATGFLVKSSTLHPKFGVLDETYWQGWQTGADGIPFPKVVVEFKYSNGTLQRAEFRLIRETEFNVKFPDSLFRIGAPAGSVIVDSRNGNRGAFGINYDILDVLSAEQMAKAMQPLPKELTTPEEIQAVAELKEIYRLADGEFLKRIDSPQPAVRKYLFRMLGKRFVPTRRPKGFDVISWENGQAQDSFSYLGMPANLTRLIHSILKFSTVEVEGDHSLLEREISGDFLYRPESPVADLAQRLAEIASQELRTPIKLEICDVERPVYVAKGTWKINLQKDQQYVNLNGGKHTGDFGEILGGGAPAEFLKEVGSYIGTKLIDETEPSMERINWTKRWYDLPTTKTEKRFKLDPEFVLKQLGEQTGLSFTKEMRPDRILVVRTKPKPKSSGDSDKK
ncbi:MAG: polymerase sigma factor [Planctomycetaceae bacterium]|nr:polymerase sigma factor [Planctomycetaceae bacterium]